jgi:hypothetical protein
MVRTLEDTGSALLYSWEHNQKQKNSTLLLALKTIPVLDF